MRISKQLTIVETDNCGDPLYSLKEIKAKFADCLVDLGVNHTFVVHADEGWISFALFEFAQGSDDDTLVAIVFQGEGTDKPLGELRHIYWGPDAKGYTFYLPGKAVIKALEHLQKYFDM